ncbi:hypothetical protein D8I24_2095 [Cupriavidus necator H850]|nr:hypothetical protein D8I24_2095 [Cupriavidus necator H850]
MQVTSPVKALRQAEVTPPPALAAAMPMHLFERLRMNPIPVLVMDSPSAGTLWGGFCPAGEYTEQGEIVIGRYLVEPAVRQPRHSAILSTYLHEAAHRLLPDQHHHNAAFGAMMLVLYLRAGSIDGADLWQSSGLYDYQDEAENLPQGFNWAWRTANELAATELPAEECAEIIAQRYGKWQDWLAGAAERKQARLAKAQANAQYIESLKETRLVLAGLGFTAGMLAGAMIALQFVA